MGTIRTEVRDKHLRFYPEEEEILKPFLAGFFVTWARRRRAYNTELSVYFLNPEPFMKEAYGFSQEILLVYSPYNRMEPRTIQAAEQFINTEPAKGRVEKLNYFIVSEAKNVQDWLKSYVSVNQESRIIVAFCASELRTNQGDSWFVRRILNHQLYGRDLFDYRLPLQKDTYFFGREDIVAGFVDAVKRAENKGLFGLRKTGKTSLLYKLERIIRSEKIGGVFYYDCKSPSIRKLRWFKLLKRIMQDISQEYGIPIKGRMDEIGIADSFARLISRVRIDERIVLVFDEIEYISPIAIEDRHWQKDYIDFWQTFWACQSRYRKISTIIAGVNPGVVEMDTVNRIQNPLFGIVSYHFLEGLGFNEMKVMIRVLGKKMGLKFEPDAVEYIHNRYGGHPLLTRIACSLLNSKIRLSGEQRPVNITKERLITEEDPRDSDLMFYCRHVVSELHQFYPDEYEMLEYLASGQTSDFVEMAAYPEYTKHLESYGLLSYDEYGLPRISIPVIGRYIGLEFARNEGRRTIYKVIERQNRFDWLPRRIETIMHDIRFLEKLISENDSPLLFGPNSFPEADSFIKIRVCKTKEQFGGFINTCNRCFIESIENYGKSISVSNYFWDDIRSTYPSLWYALHRIKIYRHNHMHLKLNPHANRDLLDYLNQDLEGRSPSRVKDLYFVLQQCVLDGLLTGIQMEVNSLS
jgi:hypothetical protein